MRKDHAEVRQNEYLDHICKMVFCMVKSTRKLVCCGLVLITGDESVYNLSKNRSKGGSSSLRPFRFRVVVTIL